MKPPCSFGFASVSLALVSVFTVGLAPSLAAKAKGGATVNVSVPPPPYTADLSALPAYQPQHEVIGTIRVGGHGFASGIEDEWYAAFQKYHPKAKFDSNLVGTSVASAQVALGLSDLSLMGREIWHIEVQGFWRGRERVPLGIRVTSGAYRIQGDAATLGAFVNKDNPISQLTMAQLDAILGLELLRGAPKQIKTWGDLGLTGEWADKPIHLYGSWLDCGEMEFIRETVLANSNLWSNEHRTQFWNDIRLPDGSILKDAGRNWLTDGDVLGPITTFAGQKAVAALAQDKYGLATTMACYRYEKPTVKPVALAVKEGGPYVDATEDNVTNRSYPLTRSTYAYMDKPPGGMDPNVKEFMRFILSREGQEIVRKGKMVPLSAEAVREELKKLD